MTILLTVLSVAAVICVSLLVIRQAIHQRIEAIWKEVDLNIRKTIDHSHPEYLVSKSGKPYVICPTGYDMPEAVDLDRLVLLRKMSVNAEFPGLLTERGDARCLSLQTEYAVFQTVLRMPGVVWERLRRRLNPFEYPSFNSVLSKIVRM